MADIQAQTPDGAIHSFPDGTAPEVVDAAVKRYLTSKSPQPTTQEQLPKAPSTLSRVGAEAAALPARLAGVQVEPNAATNWLKSMTGMVKDTLNPARIGPPEFLKKMVHEMNQTSKEGVAEFSDAAQPGAFQRKPGGPIENANPETSGERFARKAGGATRVAASFIPQFGPSAVRAGHELATGEQGDTVGGVFDAVTTVGQSALAAKPELAEQVAGKVTKPLVSGTGKLLRAANRTIIKGEPPMRMVPEAEKALTQAIQPGANVPRAQESIKIAGPRMKQVMEEQGLNVRSEGDVPATQKALELVKASKQYVHKAIEQRLGPVAELSPDTSSVADAMEKSITKRTAAQYPAAAKAIRERAATYRGTMKLSDIEETIQDANNELRNFYKKSSSTDSPVSPDMMSTQAEVQRLRTLLDESVERLGGEGVKDLKREYGALRDVERSAAKQHAVSTRVKGAGLWEGLAYLHAAGDVMSGNVLGAMKAGGMVTVGRMLKTLRDPNFLLEQSFHGPKAFKAAEPISPSAGPPAPKGLLPGPGESSSIDMARKRPGGAPPNAAGTKEATGTMEENGSLLGARGTGGVRIKGQLPEVSSYTEDADIPGVTATQRLLRAAREKIVPVERKYEPNEIIEAEGLLAQEAGAMQGGDKPGVYFDRTYERGFAATDSERTFGGTWRGVTSSRDMMPFMKQHPEWGPAQVEKALRNKDSALYRKMMDEAVSFVRSQKKGKAGADDVEAVEREAIRDEEAPF